MKHLAIFLTLLFLCSCAVQKRRYTKGYYLSALSHKKDVAKSKTPKTNSTANQQKLKAQEVYVSTGDQVISADAGNENDIQLLSLKKNQLPDSCDVLIFKDGSELRAKVLEVGSSEIKYKRCDNPDGPIFSTKKTDLFMVKFANGSREVMPAEVAPQRNTTPGNRDRVSRSNQIPEPKALPTLLMGILSLLAFIFSLFITSGWWILMIAGSITAAIIAISMGKKSLRRIEAEPDSFSGRVAAIAGRVIGIVMLSIYGLLAIILLALIVVLLI